MVGGYVKEFVRVLRPGGLVVFQLPSYTPLRRRIQWRRRLYAVLRSLGVPSGALYNRLGLFPMRMNDVAEDKVVQWLQGEGATVLEIERSIVPGSGFHDRRYWVTRP
jgi:hypothetical protein